MSANPEEARLTVPKFSSFKAKEITREKKAPKFSSFKPKEPETPRPADKYQHQDSKNKRSRHSEDRDSDGRRVRHHFKSHRDDLRHRKKDLSRPSSRSGTPDRQAPAPKPMRDDNGASSSKLYFIDIKGDPLILRYGGSDKYQIPPYYRHGSGRVLGTTGRLVIHRDGPRDQFSLRMPGEGSSAFKDRDGLRSKSWRVTTTPRRIRAKETDSHVEDDGFLSLNTSKKRKRDQNDSQSSDEEQPNYRSIEGKVKARQYSDSDSDSESESLAEVVGTERDNPLKWKSIQLSRQVKNHPHDIDAWLELSNHQDALLKAGEDIDHKALESEAHSYAEIKLSMLESALENVTNPHDRLRVLVPLVREGVKVWSGKAATKKWEGLAKDEESSFLLWKIHLDFAMSNIATFHYDEAKKMHIERLHRTIQRPDPEALEENLSEAIYIFLRLTRFMYDSGYKELAVAAWQALLELNLFRPPHTDSTEKALSEFSEFWESEVPRIGEVDAQGWATFVEGDGAGDPPEPVREEGDRGSQSRDDYKVWANLERGRAERAELPGRTMDEGADDDPFRVVMFSDIEQLLFVIPHSVLPELVPQLVDAFLIFSRLPPAFSSSTWTEDAYHDQYLAGPTTGAELPAYEKVSETDPLSEEIPRKLPPFDRVGTHTACSLDELFAGPRWFPYVSIKDQNKRVGLELSINITRQLVHAAGIQPLAQYYLGLCALKNGTVIKKPAKALLKKYPSNMGLYGAYALAEAANDNYSVATKVLMSTTELATSSNGDSFLLWRLWSWIELELGQKEAAVKRLCSAADDALKSNIGNASVTQTHILKAQQAFSSNIMNSLSVGNLEEAAIHVECLGLLSYLTADGGTEPASATQGNISAAMSIFRVQSAEFKARGYDRSKAHEKCLQFAAKILYLNATRGPFRRAYMLEQLSWIINYFPRNTIFLSLFEWADSSLRVIDELRSLIDERVLVAGHDGVSSRLFAIQHEMQRGNMNTTKAAFEYAVRSDACKCNVPVWVLFIKFCSSHKELRGSAKDVLFRALRHCPWSKDVMMEAFLTVNRDMESAQLRGMFETMTSKGLRVHLDLEEFLEARHERRQQVKDSRR